MTADADYVLGPPLTLARSSLPRSAARASPAPARPLTHSHTHTLHSVPRRAATGTWLGARLQCSEDWVYFLCEGMLNVMHIKIDLDRCTAFTD